MTFICDDHTEHQKCIKNKNQNLLTLGADLESLGVLKAALVEVDFSHFRPISFGGWVIEICMSYLCQICQ